MVQNELKGWVVAVIGGDLRMLEHMRQARLAGAVVQHYGGVPGAGRRGKGLSHYFVPNSRGG